MYIAKHDENNKNSQTVFIAHLQTIEPCEGREGCSSIHKYRRVSAVYNILADDAYRRWQRFKNCFAVFVVGSYIVEHHSAVDVCLYSSRKTSSAR